MGGIGLFQIFCLPALFGAFILSGYIYLRQEKNWLTNLVHGLIKIMLGAVCVLIGYGVASSVFQTVSEPAWAGLSQPGLVMVGTSILIALVPSALGAIEILRAIRRQSQGDERFVPFSLRPKPEPVQPPKKRKQGKSSKKQ